MAQVTQAVWRISSLIGGVSIGSGRTPNTCALRGVGTIAFGVDRRKIANLSLSSKYFERHNDKSGEDKDYPPQLCVH